MRGVTYRIERDTGGGWVPDSTYTSLRSAEGGLRHASGACPEWGWRLVRVERKVLREMVPPVSQAAGPVVGRRR